MPGISESDVIAAIGPANDLIVREMLRTRASIREFRHALAFVAGAENAEVSAYAALSGRVQRLVDLLDAAPTEVGVRPRGAAYHGEVRTHA